MSIATDIMKLRQLKKSIGKDKPLRNMNAMLITHKNAVPNSSMLWLKLSMTLPLTLEPKVRYPKMATSK